MSPYGTYSGSPFFLPILNLFVFSIYTFFCGDGLQQHNQLKYIDIPMWNILKVTEIYISIYWILFGYQSHISHKQSKKKKRK